MAIDSAQKRYAIAGAVFPVAAKDQPWRLTVAGNYPVTIAAGAGVTIVPPMTIFIVARFTDAAPGADQFLFDAKGDATKTLRLYSDTSNSDKWTLDAGGTPIALSQAYDNDAHVFTIEYNADSTTKLTVSDVGDVTGDAGSDSWDFGSTFMDIDGANTMVGFIAECLVYDSALSAAEIANNQTFLAAKWGI